MRIYTRTGDAGTTGLIGGARVSKADPRIDVTGGLDETNAAIGLAVASVADKEIAGRLLRVQRELFVIGSHVAVPEGTSPSQSIPPLRDVMVARLEQEMDAADGELPAMRHFILPGGTEGAARLHVARTTCRRAERLLVAFAQQHPVGSLVLTYLNRLSDWLFVQARLANHRAGVEDVPWVPET